MAAAAALKSISLFASSLTKRPFQHLQKEIKLSPTYEYSPEHSNSIFSEGEAPLLKTTDEIVTSPPFVKAPLEDRSKYEKLTGCLDDISSDEDSDIDSNFKNDRNKKRRNKNLPEKIQAVCGKVEIPLVKNLIGEKSQNVKKHVVKETRYESDDSIGSASDLRADEDQEVDETEQAKHDEFSETISESIRTCGSSAYHAECESMATKEDDLNSRIIRMRKPLPIPNPQNEDLLFVGHQYGEKPLLLDDELDSDCELKLDNSTWSIEKKHNAGSLWIEPKSYEETDVFALAPFPKSKKKRPGKELKASTPLKEVETPKSDLMFDKTPVISRDQSPLLLLSPNKPVEPINITFPKSEPQLIQASNNFLGYDTGYHLPKETFLPSEPLRNSLQGQEQFVKPFITQDKLVLSENIPQVENLVKFDNSNQNFQTGIKGNENKIKSLIYTAGETNLKSYPVKEAKLIEFPSNDNNLKSFPNTPDDQSYTSSESLKTFNEALNPFVESNNFSSKSNVISSSSSYGIVTVNSNIINIEVPDNSTPFHAKEFTFRSNFDKPKSTDTTPTSNFSFHDNFQPENKNLSTNKNIYENVSISKLFPSNSFAFIRNSNELAKEQKIRAKSEDFYNYGSSKSLDLCENNLTNSIEMENNEYYQKPADFHDKSDKRNKSKYHLMETDMSDAQNEENSSYKGHKSGKNNSNFKKVASKNKKSSKAAKQVGFSNLSFEDFPLDDTEPTGNSMSTPFEVVRKGYDEEKKYGSLKRRSNPFS